MAENYEQVPEAKVPRHTIPHVDHKPCIQKRFRYDLVKEQKLETLCDELLGARIMKESTSPWCSPVFLVTSQTEPADFLSTLEQSMPKPTVYSVLNLKAGYYGVSLDENSQQYTAFSTKKIAIFNSHG